MGISHTGLSDSQVNLTIEMLFTPSPRTHGWQQYALWILLALSPVAHAHDAKPSTSYAVCLDKVFDTGAFINSQRIACATQELEKLQSELGDVYRNELKRLPGKNRARLLESRKKWAAAVEAHCLAWKGLGIPPHDDVNYLDCKAGETAFRIHQLRQMTQ